MRLDARLSSARLVVLLAVIIRMMWRFLVVVCVTALVASKVLLLGRVR